MCQFFISIKHFLLIKKQGQALLKHVKKLSGFKLLDEL